MRVKNITPSQKVSEYVERILVIEIDALLKSFVLPLYANGVPTLLFTSVTGKFGTCNSNYLTLFGQTISPEQLTIEGGFTLIAYFLKPHTLISLYGIPAYELTDKPIDLNLISPPKKIYLQDQLINCCSVEEMIVTLDNYFQRLINLSKDFSSTTKYAYEKLTSDYSKESIIKVQKELNITEKSLQRMFKNNIGISPNAYRRICQFNSAFIDLNLGRYSNLSDIAYNHGYADQSHFIRSFKEFTKITPSEYLNYATN
jgi:AraC-like DNA-binding protein